MNRKKSLVILCFLLAVLVGKAQTQLNVGEKKVFSIYPELVKNSAKILIDADHDMWAIFEVRDNTGAIVLEQQMAVSQGSNSIPLFYVSTLGKGTYNTVLRMEDKEYNSRLAKL